MRWLCWDPTTHIRKLCGMLTCWENSIITTLSGSSLYSYRGLQNPTGNTNVTPCQYQTLQMQHQKVMQWMSIRLTFWWDFVIIHWKNWKGEWGNTRPSSHMNRWFWWRIWNLLLQWPSVSMHFTFHQTSHTLPNIPCWLVHLNFPDCATTEWKWSNIKIFCAKTFLSLLFFDELWSSFFLLPLSFLCRFNTSLQINCWHMAKT
jgi:hypothetical protein